MRAIQASEFGPPEVLVEVEAQEPRCGDTDVVVEHEFVGVNFVDVQHRRGHPYPMSLPLVPGIEAVGVVTSVGDRVVDVPIGARVAYGGIMPGVYAERAAIPADQAVRVPEALAPDLAAAVLVQGWTAHMLAHDALRPETEGTAVVFAAAGGTGGLLTQMLVSRGFRVLGVVSSARKAELVEAWGAEPVIGAGRDPADDVRDLVSTGVDVVFDGVGGLAFDQARRMLRPRGQLIAYGQSSGPVPAIDPAVLSGLSAAGGPGSLTLSWPTISDHNALEADRRRRAEAVFGLVLDGSLRPLHDASLGLSEAVVAHRMIEGRDTLGKLVLDARR